MTQPDTSDSALAPWDRPIEGSELTSGDLMAMAAILQADAARGRQIARNLPSLWATKERVAALLENLGTGLWRVER